jgi:hypothetical protein
MRSADWILVVPSTYLNVRAVLCRAVLCRAGGFHEGVYGHQMEQYLPFLVSTVVTSALFYAGREFVHTVQEDLFGRVSQMVQWERDGPEPMAHFFKRLSIAVVVLLVWLLTVAGLGYLLGPILIGFLS